MRHNVTFVCALPVMLSNSLRDDTLLRILFLFRNLTHFVGKFKGSHNINSVLLRIFL